MFPFRKKEISGDEIIFPKCNEHTKYVKQMSRIEGENLAILTMLGIILIVILEKMI